MLVVVQAFRSVCDQFTERGLPNYPSGVPFTFWEQYIHLRFYLLLALLCVLGTTFVVLTIVLMNPWLATVLVRHDLMTSWTTTSCLVTRRTRVVLTSLVCRLHVVTLCVDR